MMQCSKQSSQTSVRLSFTSYNNTSLPVQSGCRLAPFDVVPRCSSRQIPMGQFQGKDLLGIFTSRITYFTCIRNILSQWCKRHLPHVTNNTPVSLSRTYVLQQGVLPMLDSAIDIKGVVIDM